MRFAAILAILACFPSAEPWKLEHLFRGPYVWGTLPERVTWAKDGRHAYYPEESHIFVRDQSLIDAFRQATEFFDRNLSE